MHVHNLRPVSQQDIPPHVMEAMRSHQPELPKCGNCGTAISCGCQRVKATNGADVCDECVNDYEKSLSEGGSK